MPGVDKLVYFGVRARAEPIRMMYALAGKKLEDEIVTFEQWGGGLKEKQPLGQLPIFYTEEGGEMVMSNSIARYVAKKLGMVGSCLWEEALHDMVMETCQDRFGDVPIKIYMWKIFKRVPEPENSAEVVAEQRTKVLQGVNYIEELAKKRGKKYIIGDELGLGDLWFYNAMQFINKAFDDSMEITPWVKEFVSKVESDEKMKKYLAERPESVIGV